MLLWSESVLAASWLDYTPLWIAVRASRRMAKEDGISDPVTKLPIPEAGYVAARAGF
jgi:hypothetical protein